MHLCRLMENLVTGWDCHPSCNATPVAIFSGVEGARDAMKGRHFDRSPSAEGIVWLSCVSVRCWLRAGLRNDVRGRANDGRFLLQGF